MDEDYALALQLQADFFEETHQTSHQSLDKVVPSNNGSEPQSLVDPFWEMTDPNPDVRALFLQFNERFFWGRLAGIEVRWSPRMTLCAGLCCYEGRGGLCSVRLSVPLLKLRPRKDLVETLLHEMIHAYLFVTDNNKDHDGHGPEFHKHMYRINKEAGTNISVYHNFHDEVDSYRQHWWRCDGPCQSRKPYYGYVKRSMNRAPSKNDTWWAEHQRTCGGTYTKVKEPEDYGKKKGKQEKEKEEKKEKAKSTVKSMDIRIFGGEGKKLGNVKPGQSENNKIDLLNKIQKPSGQVFKPINPISKPKPAATVSRLESSSPTLFSETSASAKSSQNDHVTHLPGARTPDKKGAKMNKPVSQGGVGKFDNKKRSFDFPNFSDSEDSDDEVLCLVPLDKTSKTTVHSVNDDKPVLSKEVESWWVDETDDKISKADNDKKRHDVENDLEDNKNEDVRLDTKSEADEFKLGANESVRNDSEVDDVRAMLRKVWGQKHFNSKNTNMKGTGKIKSRNIYSSNSDTLDTSARIKTKDSSSAHKRLSGDTGFDVAQATKRQKSGRGISIYSPNKKGCSESEKNIHSPKNDKLTSPIDKFFRSVGGTSQSSGGTQTNSGTDRNKGTVIKEDNSQTSDKNLVSTAEMSACPVCNKSVLSSFINEHLDLCLTMQAI